MTEPELVKVLSNHLSNARKPKTVLKSLNQPDFPTLLFKEIGQGKIAFDVIKSIYYGLTVKHQELCEVEKAIIREVKSWDKKTTIDPIIYLRRCFLESDLRSSMGTR